MKIIVVKEDYQSGGCSDCGYSGQDVQVYDELSGLLASLDEQEKLRLKSLGWRNLKELTEKSEKAVLEREFYILFNHTLRNVEIDHLQSHDISALAHGACLVQRVSPKGVLTDAEYKKYQTAVKRKEDEAKAKTKANKERLEKKLAKKLEDAKKLLEEHGKA